MRKKIVMSMAGLWGVLVLTWLAPGVRPGTPASGMASYRLGQSAVPAPRLDGSAREFEPTEAAARAPTRSMHRMSVAAVSMRQEQALAAAVARAVPSLRELYMQPTTSGYEIVATATVPQGLLDKGIAQALTTRFFQTVYTTYPDYPTVYAALYVETVSGFIMAAGLGDAAASQLSVRAMSSGAGQSFVAELFALDRFRGSVAQRAFAEYKGG